MAFLRTRQREPEWMDEPDVDAAELDRSLAYIRKINRRMGYVAIVLRHLRHFSAKWKQGEPIQILDVATGSADIPAAILKWADSSGLNVCVIGLDRSPHLAQGSENVCIDPRLQLIRGDALQLPFADGAFDYAITSMFLHHLSDEEAERALAEMSRVARRGVIASDLLRRGFAYAFIWLFTSFSRPMVKHDARVSIRQSFSRAEVQQLQTRAGLGYTRYVEHLFHRFILAGEKPGA